MVILPSKGGLSYLKMRDGSQLVKMVLRKGAPLLKVTLRIMYW